MRTRRPLFNNKKLPIMLLLPSIIILVFFNYYPTIKSVVLSFYRSNLFLGTRKFIGFDNFKNLFTGPFAPAYIQVILQSILFAFLVVVLGISISLVLANVANQKLKGARIYRILLIWPFALSPAVAGTILSFLFNPEVGFVNQVLDNLLGIKPRWLDNPILAFSVVVMASVWKNLGYNIVFYLAALQNLPKDIMEAAQIDGASTLRRFFKIKIPILGPITFFLIFTNITYSFFDTFGLIDIVTKGGPVGPPPLDNAGITTIFIYKIFQDGFGGSSNLGFAAAQGVIMMLLVATITILQFRLGGRRVHYGGV